MSISQLFTNNNYDLKCNSIDTKEFKTDLIDTKEVKTDLLVVADGVSFPQNTNIVIDQLESADVQISNSLAFSNGAVQDYIIKCADVAGSFQWAPAPTSQPLTFNSPLVDNSNVVSINQSSTVQDGYLSSTDFNTFNGKQNQLSFNFPLFDVSNSVSIYQASNLQSGYLLNTDFQTFNNKQDPLTFSSPLSNTLNTISIPQSTSIQSGYLLNTDWSTFNNKQDAITTSSNLNINSLETTALKLTTSPVVDYVLTSDASGNATWQPSQGGGSSNITGAYYVSTTGQDSKGDGHGSIGKPFATIQYALNQVVTGTKTTIYIAPGTYNESINITGYNISLVGMSDDAQQNKRVIITGYVSIGTILNSGNEVNQIITLNNLTLSNNTTQEAINVSGRGVTVQLKNMIIDQVNASYGAILFNPIQDSTGATYKTRLYITNVQCNTADGSTESCLRVVGGQVWQLEGCDFTAKTTGTCFFVGANAWVLSAYKSIFSSPSGFVLAYNSANQGATNLASFISCSFSGYSNASTAPIITVGDGTGGIIGFSQCSFYNSNTSVLNYILQNTASYVISTYNTFSSPKSTATTFIPYVGASGASNLLLKYVFNSFLSGNLGAGDALTLPSAGVGGYIVVRKLTTD